MKKIILGLTMLLSVGIANAANFTVNTSCGGSYEVTCDGCTMRDVMIVVMTIEAMDCPIQ